MNPRFTYDLKLAGRALVAGADEAGRGSLAGPLVAAAVAFDYARFTDEGFAALEGLDDSKRHTRESRERLYGVVLAHASQIAVVSCAAPSIDARGLHVCNLFALERALAALRPAPEIALVDGFTINDSAVPHRGVVGGDGLSAAVAAASIVAKVTRDRFMIAMHERWPQYGFNGHVGYAAPEHRDAIVEHGVCELHRLSFQSVAYRQLGLGLATGEGRKSATGEDPELTTGGRLATGEGREPTPQPASALPAE